MPIIQSRGYMEKVEDELSKLARGEELPSYTCEHCGQQITPDDYKVSLGEPGRYVHEECFDDFRADRSFDPSRDACVFHQEVD